MEDHLLPSTRMRDLDRLAARVARRLTTGWWTADSLWIALYTDKAPITVHMVDLVLGLMDKQGRVSIVNRNGQLVYRLRNT